MIKPVTEGLWIHRAKAGDDFENWDGMGGVRSEGNTVSCVLTSFDGRDDEIQRTGYVEIPDTLAIVRVRDIEDANERIAELKREKAEAVSSLINADRRATQNSQSDYRLLMDGNMRLAIKEGRTIGRDEILTMLRALLPHANPGGMIAIDHCIYTLER